MSTTTKTYEPAVESTEVPVLVQQMFRIADAVNLPEGTKRVSVCGVVESLRWFGKLATGYLYDPKTKTSLPFLLKADLTDFHLRVDNGDTVKLKGDIILSESGKTSLEVKRYEILGFKKSASADSAASDKPADVKNHEPHGKIPTFDEVVSTCFKLVDEDTNAASSVHGSSVGNRYQISLSYGHEAYTRLETMIAALEDTVFCSDALEVNRYLVDSVGLSLLSKLQDFTPSRVIHRQYKGTYRGIPVIRVKHDNFNDASVSHLSRLLNHRSGRFESRVYGVILLVSMKSIISEKSIRESNFIYVLNENSQRLGECQLMLFDSPIRAKRITVDLVVDSCLRHILNDVTEKESYTYKVESDYQFTEAYYEPYRDVKHIPAKLSQNPIVTLCDGKTDFPAEDPSLNDLYRDTYVQTTNRARAAAAASAMGRKTAEKAKQKTTEVAGV